MTAAAFLLLASLFLAYTNGANDNVKGVATLLGSGTTDYRRALAWAMVTTFAGSLVAALIGAELVRSFSGKGLVPDVIATDPQFLAAVGFGAACTVLAATRLGFPISTTHAMTGALVGAGLMANGGSVAWAELGTSFFLPLLLSPMLALAAALVFYPLFRSGRRRLGVTEETVLIAGGGPVPMPAGIALLEGLVPGQLFALTPALSSALSNLPALHGVREAVLVRRYAGAVAGVSAQQALVAAHFASAGAVGFARGLNDAPKIVALMVAAEALDLQLGLGLVAVAMAIGGTLGTRRVADTMSHRITAMNAGQGFTANLVTALLVIGASRVGMPVSTTHVSCGALFGIGAVNGQARWRMIGQILIAWVTTLPVALIAAAVIYGLLGVAR